MSKIWGLHVLALVCVYVCAFFLDIFFEALYGLNGPRREKTCLWVFQQSEFQTSLLSYRDKLENWNFARSKSR